MAKRDKSSNASDDGAAHRPFAALSGLRSQLPKQTQKKPTATQARPPSMARAASKPVAASASSSVPQSGAQAPQGQYTRDDRLAFNQAFAGVKPLAGSKPRPAPQTRSTPAPAPHDQTAETAARARLDALVGGGVRFDVRREGGQVEALQHGEHPSHLEALRDADAAPDLELDLHGLTARAAMERISRFVREAQARGARTLLIIHGKGHGSAGAPVLGDAALEALTRGGAAPKVCALHSAPARFGGEGALLVRLTRR